MDEPTLNEDIANLVPYPTYLFTPRPVMIGDVVTVHDPNDHTIHEAATITGIHKTEQVSVEDPTGAEYDTHVDDLTLVMPVHGFEHRPRHVHPEPPHLAIGMELPPMVSHNVLIQTKRIAAIGGVLGGLLLALLVMIIATYTVTLFGGAQ